MASVQTLRGPVDSSELGLTLIHEHLTLFDEQVPSSWLEKASRYQEDLLRRAVEVGVKTIVDLFPWPNIPRLLRLSEAVPDLQIVLSTGSYLQHLTPEPIRSSSEEAFEERMSCELTSGYEGFKETGVRAGIIKVAGSDLALTRWEEERFRAAARVHRAQGVPIATHACGQARRQMELLRDHGAHLPACFFSHPEWKPGWEGRDRREQVLYLQEITEAGGGIQLNNFGLDFDTPYEDLLFLIEELERAGFGREIFLSTDCNWQFDEHGTIWHYGEREHPGMDRRAFDYLLRSSVPRLLASGVSPLGIHRYLVDNPRRLFESAADSGSEA